MKYNFIILLFAVIVVSACAPGTPSTQVSPAVSPLAAPSLEPVVTTPSTSAPVLWPEFDAHQAFLYNQELAVAVGSRVAGSDSGYRARDYIAQQFSDAALVTETQPFSFQAWEDRGTSVEVMQLSPQKLDAQPIQYSLGGTVEAEVQPVRGNGTIEDFASVNVNGKIALIARGTVPFSDKARNAATAGAVATLIYNSAPGGFTGTLKDPVTIPTIGISGQAGRALLDQAAQGSVTVRIASDTLLADKTGYNVIGRLQGTLDDSYVLGGHYDSVQAGPGADDNGSGTAVLLELARVLGKSQHKYTYVIVAFDGEELGLYGSRYYTTHVSDADKSHLKGMLNFDMLAAGSGPLLLGGEGRLGASARDVAGHLGVSARDFQLGGNAGSDHQSFQSIGVDTVFFSRDYNLLHTPQDTIDQVKEQWLDEAGRVAVRLIDQLEGKSN